MDMLQGLIGSTGEDLLWWQMCLRAVIVFVLGLAIVRMGGKRVRGRWGAIDVVLFVIVGSNLSRTITGEAPLLPTLAATVALFLLHSLLTSSAARWPALGPLLKGRPAQLMAEGELNRDAMRRHGVGEGDLQEALRSSGRTSTEEAREIWIERNGHISIIGR
jgi:uncharacterized membrane protein YcaP (DUF421 family)